MRRGASMNTQWYWPEQVGAMEASSARGTMMAMNPAQDRRKDVKSPALPPLLRPY